MLMAARIYLGEPEALWAKQMRKAAFVVASLKQADLTRTVDAQIPPGTLVTT